MTVKKKKSPATKSSLLKERKNDSSKYNNGMHSGWSTKELESIIMKFYESSQEEIVSCFFFVLN